MVYVSALVVALLHLRIFFVKLGEIILGSYENCKNRNENRNPQYDIVVYSATLRSLRKKVEYSETISKQVFPCRINVSRSKRTVKQI